MQPFANDRDRPPGVEAECGAVKVGWSLSVAASFVCAVPRIGLRHKQFTDATAGTIRLKLFKIGALAKVSARRIKFALPAACPDANEWRLAAGNIARAAPV